MLGKPENLVDTQNLGWGRGVGGIREPWHPSVPTHEETVVGTLLEAPDHPDLTPQKVTDR